MTALPLRSLPALLASAFAAAGSAAQASSPAAWAQHEKETRQACAAASDLKDPVVHAYVAPFDDTVGMDARLVTGTWKPAQMKGAKGVMLCLYDRKARRGTGRGGLAGCVRGTRADGRQACAQGAGRAAEGAAGEGSVTGMSTSFRRMNQGMNGAS